MPVLNHSRTGVQAGCLILLLLIASCAAPPERGAAGSFTKPVSFSILEDYDKGDDLSRVQEDFALFRELGIDTWRGSFGWDDYEPAPEANDFQWLHRFVELAASHHIDLRPYIGYTPRWAARPGGADEAFWNNPPDDISDWRDFVSDLSAAMARHGNVLSFEIYNEENAPMWWDGSAQEYRAVLDAGSRAVRDAGGDDQVLFGGLTYPDLDWMEAVCGGSAGAPDFDILPIHAYPETWTPEGTEVENYLDGEPGGYFFGTFLPAVDEACGEKPIWLNEVGFATTPGRTERDQANWWARAFATFLSHPRIEHIGIYEIREPKRTVGVIGGAENYYLGLVTHDGEKKLAFHTVRLLVGLLGTGTLTVANGELAVRVLEGDGNELYRHLFVRPDGRQVLFLWDKSDSPVVDVSVLRKGSRVIERHLDGSSAAFLTFDGNHLRGVDLSEDDVRIFEILP